MTHKKFHVINEYALILFRPVFSLYFNMPTNCNMDSVLLKMFPAFIVLHYIVYMSTMTSFLSASTKQVAVDMKLTRQNF